MAYKTIQSNVILLNIKRSKTSVNKKEEKAVSSLEAKESALVGELNQMIRKTEKNGMLIATEYADQITKEELFL